MKKYSKLYSAQLSGLEPVIITIETDITNGLHAFAIVGLGDKAVNEARDRVSAAIKNSGFVSPKQKNQKVVTSLSPAHIKKEGSRFDLGIALSYLAASKHIIVNFEKKLFLGELSLEGRVLPVREILAIIHHMDKLDFAEIYIPAENASDVVSCEGISIYPVKSLRQIIKHLEGIEKIEPLGTSVAEEVVFGSQTYAGVEVDMAAIRGHEYAKRALIISAIGRHNLLMSGPPGVGKTMLAKGLAGILPRMSQENAVDVASLHSIANITIDPKRFLVPPIRSPHHTSSYSALIGGGSPIRPGEMSLAHNGILFLDEFPEFDRRSIESLRQSLEEKVVRISRLKGTVVYPANFMFVGAMNPCPCGYGDVRCVCSEPEQKKYQSRISGAILDRIDIFLELDRVRAVEMSTGTTKTTGVMSVEIRNTIEQIKEFQQRRVPGVLSDSAREFMNDIAERLSFSNRAYVRTIRVAQSIADFSKSEIITKEHLLEALQYRKKFGGN